MNKAMLDRFFTFPLYIITVGMALLVIFAVAVYFHPLGAEVYSFKRAALVEEFFIEVEGGIDSHDYWQFREQLGAGSHVLNDDLLTVTQIVEFTRRPEPTESVTEYYSNYVSSREFLLETEEISKLIERERLEATDIIYIDDRSIIVRTDESSYRVLIHFTLEEFFNTHGLFDFLEDERELLEGLEWLSIMELRTGG